MDNYTPTSNEKEIAAGRASKVNHGYYLRRIDLVGYDLPYLNVSGIELLRRMVLQDFKCPYCDIPIHISSCEFDHVYPVVKGGKHCIGNLVATCEKCNGSKASLTLSAWCRKKKKDYFVIQANIDAWNVQMAFEHYQVWP